MNYLKNIKAIFFDFDDTLADRYNASYRTIYRFLLTETDISKDNLILLETIAQDFLLIDQYGNNYFNNSISTIVQKYGFHTNVSDFHDWWKKNLFKETVLFDDVLPALNKLSRKYRLGIITNGSSSGQRGKINLVNIQNLFEIIVISDEIGYEKPDKAIFEYTSDLMKLDTKECAYVGDMFSYDVYGAYMSGMIPIWITRHQPLVNDIHFECLRIESLSELTDILPCQDNNEPETNSFKS